jgi:predicted HicB family RNase H-like nuclease
MTAENPENCMIEYKGFVGQFSFNEKDEVFRGRVANSLSLVTFEGKSVREIHQVFYKAIDEYLEWRKKYPNK